MDENGNTLDSDKMKWKTIGQGVSTSIVAAFNPTIAGKPSSSDNFELDG